MFTGIVEAVGTVVSMTSTDSGRRLTIHAPTVADGLAVGDSVAVSGACLTVTTVRDGAFTVDIVGETLSRTTLGALGTDGHVNLERAMPAAGRFDGHLVQGHVDGIGTVVHLTDEGEGVRLAVRCPSDLLRYVVEKGSITVDGVSLTVAGLGDDGFEIALIPHTLEVTTLGDLGASDRVNLEVDILSKYVERLMESRG